MGAVRGVIDGHAPAVQIDEEEADDVRGVTARLMARGATRGRPGLAGNHRRRFVCAQARSVHVGDGDLMHGSAEKPVREMRQ
jgi:hypothetical protein